MGRLGQRPAVVPGDALGWTRELTAMKTAEQRVQLKEGFNRYIALLMASIVQAIADGAMREARRRSAGFRDDTDLMQLSVAVRQKVRQGRDMIGRGYYQLADASLADNKKGGPLEVAHIGCGRVLLKVTASSEKAG